MKLYYSPGTCSLALHILLAETGLPCERVRVDLASKRTEAGVDFHTLNPKGYVPLLELDEGQLLSEGPVIAQYLCERAGRGDLLPQSGDPARYRVLEWQAYISSELHKGFSPLFNPALAEDAKALLRSTLAGKFAWVSEQLQQRDFLCSGRFTLADAYLFTVSRWSRLVGPDLQSLAPLQRYLAAIAERPAVQAALAAEGLDA